MTDRQGRSGKNRASAMGSNPSKATSQLLSDYLELGQINDFGPLKRGVFEPDFNPIDFERKVSILCQETRVRFTAYPDIEILAPKQESKQESIPVLLSENGELCKEGMLS